MEQKLDADFDYVIEIIDGTPYLISTEKPRTESIWFIDINSHISEIHIDLVDIGSMEDRNIFNSKEEAERNLALIQCIWARDQINKGWKPNWAGDDDAVFAILPFRGDLFIRKNPTVDATFAFRTREETQEFLNENLEIIKKALL